MRLVAATGFLAFINILGSLAGFVQGVLVAKFLGPAQLGVVAIMVAIAAVTTNFVDIRIGDLLAKLFYEEKKQEDDSQYKAALFKTSIILQAILSGLVFCIVYVLGASVYSVFTDQKILDNSFIYVAAGYSLIYFGGLFIYLQRFMEAYLMMGFAQLVVSLGTAVIIISMVIVQPSVNGYAKGLFFSSILSATIAVSLCMYLWIKKGNILLFKKNNVNAWKYFGENWRLLVKMKFLTFAKLLHRAADVLLVGLFCNDQQTGFYKLARSLTDAFYMIYDAVNKVMHPRFYTWIKEKNSGSYKYVVTKIIGWTVSLTIGVILLELLLLDDFISIVFGSSYRGVEASIIILTVPLLFVLGLHTWLWPLLVKRGGVGKYTLFYLVAIIVGQYLLGISFYTFFNLQGAQWFALSYMISYPLHYLLISGLVRAKIKYVTQK